MIHARHIAQVHGTCCADILLPAAPLGIEAQVAMTMSDMSHGMVQALCESDSQRFSVIWCDYQGVHRLRQRL